MGNYKGFGDSKIIPNLTADKLENFLFATKAFQTNADLVNVWNRIKNLIYDLSPKKCHLTSLEARSSVGSPCQNSNSTRKKFSNPNILKHF